MYIQEQELSAFMFCRHPQEYPVNLVSIDGWQEESAGITSFVW